MPSTIKAIFTAVIGQNGVLIKIWGVQCYNWVDFFKYKKKLQVQCYNKKKYNPQQFLDNIKTERQTTQK